MSSRVACAAFRVQLAPRTARPLLFAFAVVLPDVLERPTCWNLVERVSKQPRLSSDPFWFGSLFVRFDGFAIAIKCLDSREERPFCWTGRGDF